MTALQRTWNFVSAFVLLDFSIFVVGSENACILKQSAKWLFKVIQGHWIRYLSKPPIYNFLLVISSNLGPVLLRFRDIAGFLLWRATSPLFHPNFWGCSPWIADVVAPRSEDPTLIIRVINFEKELHTAVLFSASIYN